MANLDTRADIIADIKDRFDDTSGPTDVSAKRWINQVLMEIWGVTKWKFAQKEGTITTTADDAEYSLASDYDFSGIYAVRDTTNDHSLSFVGNRDFDSVYPDPSATGAPLYYRLWGIDDDDIQKIQLYPIPAGTYTLKYKYYFQPSNMTEDSDIPPIPNRYRELLVLGVLARLEKKDENPNFSVTQAKFDQLLNQMIADYSSEPGDIPVFDSLDNVGNSTPTVRFPSNFPAITP